MQFDTKTIIIIRAAKNIEFQHKERKGWKIIIKILSFSL